MDADGIADPLDAHPPPIRIAEPVNLAGHEDDAVAGQHFAGARKGTEPRCKIQRAATVAVRGSYSLSRLESDSDPQRQRRVLPDRVGQAALEGDRRPHRLPWRVEDAKRLVAARLHHLPPAVADHVPCQLGKPRSQAGSLLVAVVARERRVAADVRDQECADACRAGWVVYRRQVPILVRGASRVSFRVRGG